jgi:hypothetical protein
MATLRIPVNLDRHGSSAGVSFESTALHFGANDRYPTAAVCFKDTSTREKVGFSFTVPKNYLNTPRLVLVSSTRATAGNRLRLEVDLTATAAGETLDPSADQASVSVNQPPPATARLALVTTFTLTANNFAADDLVTGCIVRDGADGNPNADDVAGDWFLFEAYFQYADA